MRIFMGFLTPFMLWGALAAGIPVAIHFFFRSRYRTVPWAAMKFLLTAVEQTSRRLKFQELLLLLLRMAVLVMLALAFARPISTVIKGAGRGEAVDAVLVFDLSYSMGANDGAKTRLVRAQDEAIKIIDELPPHSTVQIITCAGNARELVGPRAPGNLDQARELVKNLELTSLATNLSAGVNKAYDVITHGQASNKELYVFSDMQRQGFTQEADKLKGTLLETKEKALVHMVRCGTRNLKNATIESIVPQAGVPRPGERVDFAVVVRNTGSEAISNVRVSLTVDEDERKLKGAKEDRDIDVKEIPKIPARESRAITLTGKLAKPGVSVLTARIETDDVPGDNRFDQVILVRDQVRVLVVDGSPASATQDPSKGSSYALMHALLPVKETDRATFKYNPRMVPAREATADHLKDHDICILVNCALQTRIGSTATPLRDSFIEKLDGFVREGHGLIVFSGDNVQPEPYNRVLGKKWGLLPMPIKSVAKATEKDLWFVSRDSFGKGPPSYWRFAEDKYYEIFDAVVVMQHVELDESNVAKKTKKKDVEKKDAEKKDENAETKEPENADAVEVIARLHNNKAIAVSKRVDKGEVIFFGTASQQEGTHPKTELPNWTNLNKLPCLVFFMDVTLAHLMKGQTQTYNVTAGEALNWYPSDKHDHVYDLVHPDRNVTRLGVPTKLERTLPGGDEDVKKKREALNVDRYLLTAADLPRAGVYRIVALPRGVEASETVDPESAVKKGSPVAVIPDATETEDLSTLSAKQIDDVLGFTPIHIVAGEEAVSTGEDRLNREWTVWVLLIVLFLVLCEVVLAWWCGRAW